jgi:rhamnosyltransferase
MTVEGNVWAIIVTFHPEPARLTRVLERVAPQVERMVLVDNGSDPNSREWLRRAAIHYGAELVVLGANLGVGAGQNRGIAMALRDKGAYVLLLDQDSIPTADMVQCLRCAHQQLAARGRRVAAVGPAYLLGSGPATRVFVRFGIFGLQRVNRRKKVAEPVPVDFLISSGCLIPMDSLRDVGGMEEALFIDHIDTEWFLRARSRGYHAYGVPEAIMEHALGEKGSKRFWLGRWRVVPRHRPERYYYIFRNSLLLYRRHYIPAIWVWNDLLRLTKLLIFLLLLRAPRRRHAFFVGRGLLDGWLGRVGALE